MGPSHRDMQISRTPAQKQQHGSQVCFWKGYLQAPEWQLYHEQVRTSSSVSPGAQSLRDLRDRAQSQLLKTSSSSVNCQILLFTNRGYTNFRTVLFPRGTLQHRRAFDVHAAMVLIQKKFPTILVWKRPWCVSKDPRSSTLENVKDITM